MVKNEEEVDLYEARLSALLPFATPLAPKKLNKKIMKTVKRASKAKMAKRGVKEVVKALRKGEKGIVIIAGDIWPMDVISHLPVLCEDAHVPYVYTPSKEELGNSGSTKMPTSCIMITPKAGEKTDDFQKSYDEVIKAIEQI